MIAIVRQAKTAGLPGNLFLGAEGWDLFSLLREVGPELEGAHFTNHFAVDAPAAITEDVKELAEDVGGADRLEAHAEEKSAVVVGRFGARSRVKPGEQIDVAVDTRQLHFFDVESGAGIYDDGA